MYVTLINNKKKKITFCGLYFDINLILDILLYLALTIDLLQSLALCYQLQKAPFSHAYTEAYL